ncbi:MAG: MBL fold metallo-hydrolase [Candidatus Cloacimonetes bacterium]|nr:MBL fold metallo-hydrolase [Candidatus Cloacimonadota bacterium]
MRKILLLGDIDVNCFFIERNNKCYIVDPGYEKEKVQKYVKNNKLEVLGILLTHGHIDHIGAIDSFDVPVYLHKKEYEIIIDNYKNGFDFYGKEPPYSLDKINLIKIDESTVFEIDDKKIEVIHTPGHTIGGVCYKFGNDVFTGDTLFTGSVGRWDFPTGDLNTLKKTVVNLIDSQADKVRIHPAHGPGSTIKIEKNNNFYYREWKSFIQ